MLYHNTKTGECGISLIELRKRFPHVSIPRGTARVFEYELYQYAPRPHTTWMQVTREVAPINGQQQWLVEEAPDYIITERLEQRIKNVVLQRNQLLMESDWTQLSDSLTPETRKQWATYRQQLRELDVHSGFVIWPAKPEV